MPPALSTKIFEELSPYVHLIEKLDLFGLGEPLLDPHLMDRIRDAKKHGFRNIAISTNAELLTAEKRTALLDTGIDTIIFSIDGIRPETHEAIRKKLHYKKILENCLAILAERDAGKFPTRFVVRFIRQDSNREEWEEYAKFWGSVLNKAACDLIIRYDAHSWSGAVESKEKHLQSIARDPYLEMKPCWHVFEHFVVLADGTVPLCSEDWHKATVQFGNVGRNSVLEIFNNRKYQAVRRLHAAGTKTKISLCRECTVHYSMPTKLEICPQ